MARGKKKKRSGRPPLHGTSQFARFASSTGVLVKPAAPADTSGGSPATDPSSQDSAAESSPLISLSDVALPDPIAIVAAPSEIDTVEAHVSRSVSPSALASSSGGSPATLSLSEVVLPVPSVSVAAEIDTVEAHVSGSVSPANDSASDAPSQNQQVTSTEKALPTLEKKWTRLLTDPLELEECGTPTQHISGAPFVLIPDENIEAAKEEFKDFIYAQFHGNCPEMGRVIGVVNALWARSGPRIFVHNIGPGIFLLKVTNSRTRALLLGKHVWNIAGFPMFVAPWSPDFSPDSPQISTALVTAEFRGIPYYLFNKESLSRIATAVGKPVTLAPETERKESFEVAKVLVRVDLTKELPAKVVVGFRSGREIESYVSYPWLPPRCLECNAYGHDRSQCKLRPHVSESGRRLNSRSQSRPRRNRRSRQGRSLVVKERVHHKDSILLNGALAEWRVKEGPRGPPPIQSEEIPESSKGKEVSGIVVFTGKEKVSVEQPDQQGSPDVQSAQLVVDLVEESAISVVEKSVSEAAEDIEDSVDVHESGLEDKNVGKSLEVSPASEVSAGILQGSSSGPILKGSVSSAEVEASFILVKRRKSGRKAKLSR